MHVLLRFAASTIWVVLAATGSSASDDPPSQPLSAGRTLIASRLPRVAHRGGPILRHPEITTVTFAGESPAEAARLEVFGDRITRSGWWRAVTDGYCLAPADCIGDGRPGRHVRLGIDLPAAVRDVDIESRLSDQVRRGSLARLGQEALVLVYLPSGVTLRDAFHEHYCRGGPRAYHRTLTTDGRALPYAVIPRCAEDGTVTGVASHEILEATTNPDPNDPGFRMEPGPASVAFASAGEEPVDPCGVVTRDGHWTFESGFAVQRAWSNRAAAAGHDPCVPSHPSAPYVALVPRSPVLRLPYVGATATIQLDAAADRPVGGWRVSAIDLGAADGGPCVEGRLDRAQVLARDVAVLTLRATRIPSSRQCLVGIISTLGARSYLWPIMVSLR